MVDAQKLQLIIMIVSATASIVGATFTTLIALNIHRKLRAKFHTN